MQEEDKEAINADHPTEEQVTQGSKKDSEVAAATNAKHKEKQSILAGEKAANPDNKVRPLRYLWQLRKHHPWQFLINPSHSNAFIAIFSFFLFIATTMYTIFAALQWTTMKRQAGTADLDLITAERAYLASGEPRQDVLGRQGPVFIPIINSGHIPVIGPIFKIVYTRVEPGKLIPIDEKAWTRRIGKQFIFPGPGFNLVLNPPRLSNADTFAIEKKRESEYISVTGTYNPGFFLTPEAFTFCIEYTPAKQSWTSCGHGLNVIDLGSEKPD